MKPFSPKRFSWAGLLASGMVIVAGFVSSLFVIMAFSDAQRRDVAIVIGVFAVIVLIPILALRTPRDPADKKRVRWWMFWRRVKRRNELAQKYWRRRRGQTTNQPFGHREVANPSTFVATRRKPTEP